MSAIKKPMLEYVESEISEFCNLNCKGCGSFSNLADRKAFYPLEVFTRDYQRLAELFESVKKIRLLGGEPLLNPELTEYVKTCRELFPEADIRIVTNGLLIPLLPEETLLTIKALDCKFDISNYAPTRKNFPKIKSRLKDSGIEYTLGVPMFFFFRNILEHPANDPAPAFNNCIFTHCYMLSYGKISPCSHAHCIGRLNQRYGLNYPETDCIDIYSGVSGEEIIQKFSTPHEFCRYCNRGMVPFRWQCNRGREKANQYDWIIKDNFVNSSIVPIIQSALKTPAVWLRSQIQK